MLNITDVLKPVPKNINIEIDKKNIGCFFNYKKYVSVKELCKNLLSVSDDKLYSALDFFAKNHYKYRDTLYYNLQTVTVEDVYSDDLNGFYLLEKDINVIAYISLEDCYHELLHMASTSFDSKTENLCTGFGIIGENERMNFGEGITDGYIELLVTRELYNDKELINPNEDGEYNVPVYLYSKTLARQLEIIVGKELLEDMFFKNGFERLKAFLMKYKSEKEVMQFFKNCDAANLADQHNNIVLNRMTLLAQDFLFDICKNYMPDKLSKLSEEEITKLDKVGFELTTDRIQRELEEDKKSR